MDVTISQVRERTPIQTQGIVTVFRNWLNWWYVNAASKTKFKQKKMAKCNLLLFTYMHVHTQTQRHLFWSWRVSSLYPPAGQRTQLHRRSWEPRLPAPADNTATSTAWSLSRVERNKQTNNSGPNSTFECVPLWNRIQVFYQFKKWKQCFCRR